jgi:nitrogen fixation protein NifU and related proteins
MFFEESSINFMNHTDFNFWQHHSIRYLEAALDCTRHETPVNPDGYGKKTGGCGDTVEYYLSVQQNRIACISFSTDGCLNTNACANALSTLCEGKSIEECWSITPEAVADYLETLPVQEIHCAELAVGAFYLALASIQKTPEAGQETKRPQKQSG